MKALPAKAADVRIAIRLRWTLFGEHVEAANNGELGFIVRKILGDVEREAKRQLRKALLEAGINERMVNSYLIPEPEQAE